MKETLNIRPKLEFKKGSMLCYKMIMWHCVLTCLQLLLDYLLCFASEVRFSLHWYENESVYAGVCVFVWEYKRITACSHPRVQPALFLIISSVNPIGWWGINLPLGCYVSRSDWGRTRVQKQPRCPRCSSQGQESIQRQPENPPDLHLWHPLLFYW